MRSIANLFLNNNFIIILISLNAFIIFIQGFFVPGTTESHLLDIVDHILTISFLLEAISKIWLLGYRTYFRNGWNLFDFSLVIIALPSLVFWITPIEGVQLDFLLAFRILRVFKFFRVLRFVPDVENLILGIIRAVRSSVLIVFAFFIFNFIFAILSFYFFGKYAPEHFRNPLMAFYSTFKVFTVEGWYEIPDLIAERTEDLHIVILARVYFVIMLFGGGIFGLSLINSIFVDSMMSDNTKDLEKKVEELTEQIQQLSRRLEQKN